MVELNFFEKSMLIRIRIFFGCRTVKSNCYFMNLQIFCWVSCQACENCTLHCWAVWSRGVKSFGFVFRLKYNVCEFFQFQLFDFLILILVQIFENSGLIMYCFVDWNSTVKLKSLLIFCLYHYLREEQFQDIAQSYWFPILWVIIFCPNL